MIKKSVNSAFRQNTQKAVKMCAQPDRCKNNNAESLTKYLL